MGAGLVGRKRAAAIGSDELVGCYDVVGASSEALAADYGGRACRSLEELLELRPDIVIVAAVHSELAGIASTALEAGASVLVEKPAGVSVSDIDNLATAEKRSGLRVKVGLTIVSTRASLGRLRGRGPGYMEMFYTSGRGTATAAGSGMKRSGELTRLGRAAAR